MNASRPLFDFDAGWLFIAAGLAILVAAIILPAQRQLHDLHEQVRTLQVEERTALERLRAHAAFRDLLEREDPALMARLAASQLNLIRRGDRLVLLASTSDAPLTDWIDATVKAGPVESRPHIDSRLMRLVTGDHRHWVVAAAFFCVFLGVMLGPVRARAGVRREASALPEESAAMLTDGAVVGVAAVHDDRAEEETDAEAMDADADDFAVVDADEEEEEDACGQDALNEEQADADLYAETDGGDEEEEEYEEDEDEEWEDDEEEDEEDFDDDADDADDDEWEEEDVEDEDGSEDEEWDEEEDENEDEDEEWDEDDEADDEAVAFVGLSEEALPVARVGLSVAAPADEREPQSEEAGVGEPEIEVVRRVQSVAPPR